MKINKKYKSEKDMCDELIHHSNLNGWVSYPEQGNWDILLVKNNIQVGIQAKLRPNIKVLSQAICCRKEGPHYRAVAVGNSNFNEMADFHMVAAGLKLVCFDMTVSPMFWLYKSLKLPFRYYRHFPEKTVWLPPFVPSHDAGIKSPISVTPWKVAAVKLEMMAREKGWVSIIDSREVVQQEVPLDCMGSYPNTLLKTYFKSTKEKDPRNKRCKKWILRTNNPSKKFKDVYAFMKGK
jgi:hypothetical protein